MKNVIVILMLLSVLFVSCNDEDLPIGGGKLRVAATVTPPIQQNSTIYEYLGVMADSFAVFVTSNRGGGNYVITPYIPVYKGQKFQAYVECVTYGACRNVKIEFIIEGLNGDIVATENLSMGYSSAYGVSPATTCPDGVQNYLTYTVP